MADAWVKQVIQNGFRDYIAQYNLNFTATSPLTGYVAADPTASGDMGVNIGGNVLYPGVHLKIWRMQYDMSPSQALKVSWDATSAQVAVTVNGQGSSEKDYEYSGGLYVPQSAGAPITGATGKILFDTVGTPSVGDFVSVWVWYKKDVKQ